MGFTELLLVICAWVHQKHPLFPIKLLNASTLHF